MSSRREGAYHIALGSRGLLRDVLSEYVEPSCISELREVFEEKVARDPRVADLIRRVARGDEKRDVPRSTEWLRGQ